MTTIESTRVEKLANRLPVIAREHGWEPNGLVVQRSRNSAQLSNLDEALLHQILDPRSSRNIRLNDDMSVGLHILSQFDPKIGPSPFDIVGRLLDDEWTDRCDKVVVESRDTTFFGGWVGAEIVRFSGAGRLNAQIAQNVASLMVEYFGVHMERSSIAWTKRQCSYKPIVMQRIGREWYGAKLL